MKKICTECKETFTGRADKKFCSDQCRTIYNNRLNSDTTNFIRNINNTLRRNRRILVELNPNGKAKVHRDQMLEKGFMFSYFTNEYITKSGNVYRFCYEYGYMSLEKNRYALVIRQEYVE